MKFKLFAMVLVSAVALVFTSAYAKEHEGVKEDSKTQEGAATGGQELSSDTIMQAQQALSQQGYDIESVDGQMGDKTKEAVKKFQEDKGIQASGELDQETLAALGVSPEAGAAAGGAEGDAASQPDSMKSEPMPDSSK